MKYEVGIPVAWRSGDESGQGVITQVFPDRVIIRPWGSYNEFIMLFIIDNDVSLKNFIETTNMRSMKQYDISYVYAPYKVLKGYTEASIK